MKVLRLSWVLTYFQPTLETWQSNQYLMFLAKGHSACQVYKVTKPQTGKLISTFSWLLLSPEFVFLLFHHVAIPGYLFRYYYDHVLISQYLISLPGVWASLWATRLQNLLCVVRSTMVAGSTDLDEFCFLVYYKKHQPSSKARVNQPGPRIN